MARGAYFLTMKNTFLLFCTLALFLSSCNNNGQIKCVTEISTPISENVSSTMNITLANPDDICPISMPPDNKKEYTQKGLLAKEIFYTSDGTCLAALVRQGAQHAVQDRNRPDLRALVCPGNALRCQLQ